MKDNRTKLIERLHQMREILKRGWCQGQFARRADGLVTHPRSDDAVMWCLEGARQRANYELYRDPTSKDRIWITLSRIVGGDLITWNDAPGRTLDEVLALLAECERKLTAEQETK